MSLEVRPVLGAGDRRRFVTFPIDALYRGHPCYVPQLIRDELDTLTPGRNPAFEQAEARLFLARREGRIVGRIAAILSHAANRKYGTRNLRFGWFDAVDDRLAQLPAPATTEDVVEIIANSLQERVYFTRLLAILSTRRATSTRWDTAWG